MRGFALALVAVLAAPASALSGTLYPSDYEQYLLELTNRARSNPAAEAARYGISLSEGLPAALDPAPRPPLAFDLHLVDAAAGHSRDMLERNFFGHTSSNGNTAEDRARNSGYRAIAPVAENIAWQGNTLGLPDLKQAVEDVHRDLFVDMAQPGRGHRLNILLREVKEVGYGLVTGDWVNDTVTYKSMMTTQDFTRSSLSPVLTGVVFRDNDLNGFYSPGGEGLEGVTISARTSPGIVLETTSFPSGGYSLTLLPGANHVTFSGSGVDEQSFDIVLGADNFKLDLVLPIDGTPDETPWSNPENSLDVTGDGRVAPIDVLVLVNEINASGGGELPTLDELTQPPPYFDVSGDNMLAALDVLMVINSLNGTSPAILDPLAFRSEKLPLGVPEPATISLTVAGVALLLLRSYVRRGRRV